MNGTATKTYQICETDTNWILPYNVKAEMSHGGSYEWQQEYRGLGTALDLGNDRNN